MRLIKLFQPPLMGALDLIKVKTAIMVSLKAGYDTSQQGTCCSGPELERSFAGQDWKGGKKHLDHIRKLLNAIERMFTFLAMIFAFIMVCLTAADAMGRYFLNKPISGVYEITENYLMIFAIYFAFAYAYHEGANIRITFFVSRLPSQAKLVINYFVQIFSILFILFLLVSATRMNLGRLRRYCRVD